MRPQNTWYSLTRDHLVSASSYSSHSTQNSPRGVSAENHDNNNNKSRITIQPSHQIPRIKNNRTNTTSKTPKRVKEWSPRDLMSRSSSKRAITKPNATQESRNEYQTCVTPQTQDTKRTFIIKSSFPHYYFTKPIKKNNKIPTIWVYIGAHEHMSWPLTSKQAPKIRFLQKKTQQG